MHKIPAAEFVRRIKAHHGEADKRYAFFLGAGCSTTSGIPDASALVNERWLPQLHSLKAPESDYASWLADAFPDYDETAAWRHYGAVIASLFLDNAEDRQREIETLCDACFPGFGYAMLAALMALPGGCFNVALTTNFDDLVADALYLFTESRPLVIPHESLACYIRATRTRPLIVKLHGDNRLSPQNTLEETAQLKSAIETRVRSLLHDRGTDFSRLWRE